MAHATTMDQSYSGESESNQQNKQEQTSDDKLAADLFKDYSSQNAVTEQLILLAGVLGVKEAKGIKDAYAFFAKNQIDPEKLIKDPHYRAQIKKHLEHVNFWEKKAIEERRSKLGTVINEANRAVKEVDETNKKLASFKEEHLKDYASELQNLYGLDKGEIDAIIQRAKYAIQKDPSLSVQDLVQTEAQSMARDKIKAEVKNKAKANKEKLSKDEESQKIRVLTEEKKRAFVENKKIQTINHYETQFHNALTNNCRLHLDGILVTTPPATILSQSTPQPVSIPISSPSLRSPLPTPFQFLGGFSLPSIPLLPSIGGFKTGLGILGNGFGKLFGGRGLGYIGRRGLGRFINLAGNLGKRAINRGLDAFIPGLGMAVGKINDVIKRFTGIDIEKTILGGAALLVGAVASIVIILPIIIGVGVFSYLTGDKPMTINVPDKTLGWSEFDKQYLTVNNNTQTSWQQFEKSNLTLQKLYLSLEKNAQ